MPLAEGQERWLDESAGKIKQKAERHPFQMLEKHFL
jgi:hypothetical protein